VKACQINQGIEMNILFGAQLTFIVLALVVSFLVLVWYGVSETPMWLIYASYPITAMGGGAAINLILNGIPK